VSNRPHGYARYRLDQCRCYVCGLARSKYDERRTKMMTAGTWHPFVPIDAAQEHVRLLASMGFGSRQVASLAQVERKTIRDIAAGVRHDPGRGNPRMTKVRTETAAAILAVPVDQLAASPGTYIDGTLTWQRINALLENGWTRGRIAQEALGLKVPALQLRRGRVSARNARKIAAYFNRHLGDSFLPDYWPVDDEGEERDTA
jgi:hypothetical protein